MKSAWQSRTLAIQGQKIEAFVCPFCAGNAAISDPQQFDRHLNEHDLQWWQRQLRACRNCGEEKPLLEFVGHGLNRIWVCNACRGGNVAVRPGRPRGPVEKKEALDNKTYQRMPPPD